MAYPAPAIPVPEHLKRIPLTCDGFEDAFRLKDGDEPTNEFTEFAKATSIQGPRVQHPFLGGCMIDRQFTDIQEVIEKLYTGFDINEYLSSFRLYKGYYNLLNMGNGLGAYDTLAFAQTGKLLENLNNRLMALESENEALKTRVATLEAKQKEMEANHAFAPVHFNVL